MKKLPKLIAISTITFFLVSIPLFAAADSDSDSDSKDIAQMTQTADLVFQGKVTSIDYKTSEAGDPFTFVTYQVDKVISGSYTDPTITLRFNGGFMDATHTLYSMSSEQPTFDVGDEDMLFVKGNGDSGCPLVGCTNGRIRVIQGIYQDDSGHELLETSNQTTDTLETGDRIPSQTVDTHKAGNMTFSLKYSERPAGANVKKYGQRITSESLNGLVAKHRPKNPKKVVSANKGQKILSRNTLQTMGVIVPTANQPDAQAAQQSFEAISPTEQAILNEQKAQEEINQMAIPQLEVDGTTGN
ncbi:hypothetical protein VSS37_01380 [Candidatus Thiothrix sp. Deng01]|uniref:Organic solvent tolerance-like N-terminal domain-containing protein n=1 Tax=Candidatus Thiothrix phosphatis TaxID=3112415 RepID=A0ABU6CS15_9GAMM|nr:hypothetical protein [Candidatus Thiothrix sp. Deng01]MEB4589620.1 hypothetical protein [Candidatus Thiothrix sp. Deng01]